MANIIPRSFNCKDEELPVIGRFTAFSLKRDLTGFTNYSPKFNDAYVSLFEGRIAEVSDLVAPKSETTVLKIITERLYGTMNGLINPINRLTGYINLAHEKLKISPTDFGLTLLRKGINSKDAESVIKNLNLVNLNIGKYRDFLSEQGLQEDLVAVFVEAVILVSADKQTQYEITRNRKVIVQSNLGSLNGLFDMISEIHEIGKILYKDNDAAKLQEYTFTELKKRVRKTSNPSTTKPDENGTTPNTPEA